MDGGTEAVKKRWRRNKFKRTIRRGGKKERRVEQGVCSMGHRRREVLNGGRMLDPCDLERTRMNSIGVVLSESVK